MPATRSSKSDTSIEKVHKKFDDEEFHTADEGSEPENEEAKEQISESEDDSDDSDDSDDAPEEESVNTGKFKFEEETAKNQELLEQEAQKQKQKRIEQQERFTKQKELKKLKLRKLEEQNLLQQQKGAKISKEREIKLQNKKIEEDLINKELVKEIKKTTQLQKLRKFKQGKTKARKVAGGIHVKIIPDGSKAMKNSINKDALLNRRKKKLNKKI